MRNFFSLLGGAVLGAVAALLLAPQSGEETRAKIRELLKEKMPNLSKEKIEELVDQVVEKAKSFGSDKEEEPAEA